MASFREMILRSEDDDLSEQAIARKGNWDNGVNYIRNLPEDEIDRKYDIIHKFKLSTLPGINLELMNKRHTAEYIVGYRDIETIETKSGSEEKERFKIIFMIQFSNKKSLAFKTGSKKLMNVDGVASSDEGEFRRSGIAVYVYKYFVKEKGWHILGDKEQFYGARKLWSRLSKELDVKVDIINTETNEIEFEDIILHHGKYDEDFDARLWSYEGNKEHLRSVLKDILN